MDVIDFRGSIWLTNLTRLKDIPDNVIKLFIARQPIKNMEKYNLYHVTNLAPSEELFNDYKGEKINWYEYVKRFRKEMIKMEPILNKIYQHILNGESVALICYCNLSNKCHRGLLGDYFKEIGINVIIA